jgi:hypothetical protein
MTGGLNLTHWHAYFADSRRRYSHLATHWHRLNVPPVVLRSLPREKLAYFRTHSGATVATLTCRQLATCIFTFEKTIQLPQYASGSGSIFHFRHTIHAHCLEQAHRGPLILDLSRRVRVVPSAQWPTQWRDLWGRMQGASRMWSTRGTTRQGMSGTRQSCSCQLVCRLCWVRPSC